MSFFRRLVAKLFGSRSRPSAAWARLFDEERGRRFEDLVKAHFRGRGAEFRLEDGLVVVQDEDGAKQQLGLMNLAQLCARSEPLEWRGIIEEHFRTLEKSHREQQVLEERVDDFERIEELLAVRLWPREYLSELDGDKLIHREDLPGTLSALVFDLPSSIRNVTPEEAAGWGKDAEELFEIALDNVRENCIPDTMRQELAEGVEVTLFTDESFFVASHALLLDEHPECLGPFGALVGVPHRHVLLTFPIEDLRVLPAIQTLIPVIAGLERDGPGSISPRLYWYRDGEYLDLPYRVEEQTLNFSPPEEFVEMLNLLTERDETF